jgi:riboflavin synthase
MFTGLVEGMGMLAERTEGGFGLVLGIRPAPEMPDVPRIGDSVAINGCCLTVISLDRGLWHFQAGPETLARTNLGTLRQWARVNLELSLPAQGRLGGHFVQGHIDGVGAVARIERNGEWVNMWFKAPQALLRMMVSKGSIAVDGVSLTLVDVRPDRFSVALIPHTLSATTLGERTPGDPVNIEVDLLAKYVAKLLAPAGVSARKKTKSARRPAPRRRAASQKKQRNRSQR